LGGATLLVYVDGDDGTTLNRVGVATARDRDGLTVTGVTDEDVGVRLEVAPGRYRVFAGDSLGIWGRAEGAIEVAAGGEATVRLNLPRNPTVRVDASCVLDLDVHLVTTTEQRLLYSEEIDGADVPVPVGERVVFRVDVNAVGERCSHFIEVPGPGANVVLTGPPLTLVKASFVGPDGTPVRARLSLQRVAGEYRGYEDTNAATTASLETPLRGRVTWFAIPEQAGFDRRFGDIVLTDDDVDFGEVHFTARTGPPLRIEVPEELREQRFQVKIAMTGEDKRFDVYQVYLDDEELTCNDTGTAAAGDRLQVSGGPDEVVPYSFVLNGPPPWTVPWPSGELSVTARSADGKLLTDGVVLLDGHRVNFGEQRRGVVRLRAIQPGPHTLVVAQRDHLAKVYALRCVAGERRALDVQLSVRER
jgi:hypothetical protein